MIGEKNLNSTRNTLEAWATPVDAPVIGELKVADHTFVVCGTSRFGCWGGSDTTNPHACRVTSGSGDNALCKANNYRGPFDSACLGIYAVNGVCHQSTNLFLFAVDHTVLPLNRERPHGVIASHALYTVYGVEAPGMISTAPTFFARWNVAVYQQAYWRCGGPFGESSDEIPEEILFAGMDENSLEYRITKNNYAGTGMSNTVTDTVISDFGIITDHYLQMPEHPVLSAHTEILAEKNNLLSHYGLNAPEIGTGTKSLSANDSKDLSNSLNKLAVLFQDTLKTKIGSEAYTALNGDEYFYQPVNPDIAAKALSDLTIYQR